MSYAQWNPTTTYVVGNIVEFAGFLYQAQSINTNVSPQPTTPVWLLIGGSGGGGIVNSITAGNTNITVGGTASNVVLSGTLTDLTGNVAGNNNYISGMYAPPFGTSAIVCAGTDTFLIEDTANVPLLAVANTGLVLGGGGTLTTVPVQAPTVVPSTDNSTNVATTAFVQSVVSAIPAPTTPDLSQVLVAGNSAGASDIDLNNNDITNGATITATTFAGALTGNADTATTATNLAGGLGGSIPYQSAVDTTAFLANGTAGQVLTSAGTTLPPTWTTPSVGGTVDITDTNTDASFYPTFASSAGVAQTLRADTTTTPWSINPNLGNFTFGNNIRVQPSISRTAMGSNAGAGATNNTSGITAIGNNAGGTNPGQNSTCLGISAGFNSCGQRGVFLGGFAGQNVSGNNAIAIGYNACGSGTINANCIVLDANSGANIVSTTGASRLFIDPVRNDITKQNQLQYNTTSKEISYVAQVVSPITTSGLDLTGNVALLSGSAGSNSGQHLVIVINGATYKIKLENP